MMKKEKRQCRPMCCLTGTRYLKECRCWTSWTWLPERTTDLDVPTFSWRRRTNVSPRDVCSLITINKRTTMWCTVTASTCMVCSCGAETGDAVWEFACQRHSKKCARIRHSKIKFIQQIPTGSLHDSELTPMILNSQLRTYVIVTLCTISVLWESQVMERGGA